MDNGGVLHRFEEFEEMLDKYIEENKELYYKDEEYVRGVRQLGITVERGLFLDIFAYYVQHGFEETKKMLEGAKGRKIKIIPKKGYEHCDDYPLTYYYYD